jgi:hypothetical protein
MEAIACCKEIEQPSAIALNFLSQQILWYLVLTYYNKLSHNCFYSGRSQFDTGLVAVIKKAEMIGGHGNGVFLPQNNQSSSMKDVTIPRLIVATEETAVPFPYRKIINFPINCGNGGDGNGVFLPQNPQFSCTRYVTIAQLFVGKRHCRLLFFLFFPALMVRRILVQRCDRLLTLLV